MNKYSFLISILTLILGFTFYGEHLTINIHDTYYVIAAEVVCFFFWSIFMVIFLMNGLKNLILRK